MAQNTAVAVKNTTEVPQAEKALIDKIEWVLQDFRSQLGGGASDFLLGIAQARAVGALTDLINEDVMDDVMRLMNTQLGFKTDRNPAQFDKNGNRHKPYDRETVKTCVIVALLSGAKLIGNQFNIIAGQFYPTKEFSHQAILRFPGLSDLIFQIGDITKFGDRAAKVEAVASYKVRGQAFEFFCRKTDFMDLRLVVNCYANSSPDEIRGKAEAKLFRQILSRLTGLALDPEEQLGVDADVIETPAVVSAARVAVEKKQESAAAKPQTAAEPASAAASSDSAAAKHLLAAFIESLQQCSTVSEVQSLHEDRVKLVQRANWGEDLTLDLLNELHNQAEDTISWIRGRRGEGSNKR
jgi:hypothetical protein